MRPTSLRLAQRKHVFARNRYVDQPIPIVHRAADVVRPHAARGVIEALPIGYEQVLPFR